MSLMFSITGLFFIAVFVLSIGTTMFSILQRRYGLSLISICTLSISGYILVNYFF